MKSLLISVFALLPSLAFACPNLTGTFACPGDANDPATTTTISSSLENGVTVYASHSVDANGKVDDSKIIADGQVRQEPSESGTGMTSYTCEGDAAVRMDSSMSDPNLGNMKLVARIGIDGQNLRFVVDVTGLPNGPSHSEQLCVRK